MGWCPSLLDLSLRSLIKDPELYQPQDYQYLPPNLKDGIRDCILKRRTVTPAELSSLLHPRVRELDLQDQVLSSDHLLVLAQYKTYRKLNLNQTSPLSTHPISHHPPDIVLPDAPSSEALVQLLSGQIYLQTLFIRGLLNLNLDVFSTLSNCKHLIHLDIGGCPNIQDSHLHLIRNISGLESLSLAGTEISDTGLYHLASCESRVTLKELRIDRCKNITDDGIQILLDGLSSLEILIFHGCPQVTVRSRETLEDYLANHRRNVRQLTWTVY